MGPWPPHPPSLLPSTPRMQRRTGGPARQDTVQPPPHARPTPAPRPPWRPLRPRPSTRAPCQRVAPEGSCSSGHPALSAGYFLLPWPPPSQLPGWSPKSKSMALKRPGQSGETGQNPGPLLPALEPQPSGSAPHLEPSLAWLAQPAAPHPTGPVQPGLFFWDKMRGFALLPPGPTSFLCGGAAKELWAQRHQLATGERLSRWPPHPTDSGVTELLVQVTRPLPS